MKKILSVKNVFVSIAILISIWELLFLSSDFSETLFPSPLQAWQALLEMCGDGTLVTNIGTSMYRFLTGYVSSVIAAVFLGLMLGRMRWIFKYVNPAVQLLRPISPTAWMPFIVLLFGIGDIPAVVIIFIAAFFPVLLSTVAAVRNVNPIYLKVSQNFGIRQPGLMWKVIFPAAFPQIANGIHLAIGTAWIFLVAGEMVGAQSGLGYQIIDARNNIRADILLATILVIGFIGLLLDAALKLLEKRILKAWGGEEVSKLTGVSIRTLHYYDTIGLLKPADMTEAGYRLYDDAALERLQTILLFRELQFPLMEIKQILDSPNFDRGKALEQQIALLEMKKEHIENLIDLARGIKMIGVRPLMDFTAFDTKKIDEYARQAKESWGNTEAYKEFEEKNKDRSLKEQEALSKEFMELFAEFGSMKNLEPADERVQAQVEKFRAYITEHFYQCTTEILQCLGKMYSGGGSMSENIDKVGGAKTAQFVDRAICEYCDSMRS